MISLQISEKMQQEIDKIQEKLGFSSRSETLRESIKSFIQNQLREEPTEGYKIATITIYHEAERVDILDEFSEIILKFDNLIKTENQYNLPKSLVKTLIVAGRGAEIHEFYQTLSSSRHFQCSISYLLVPTANDD